jgi:NADH-quinone oxidoreductase subunit L
MNLIWLVILFPVAGFLIQALAGKTLMKSAGRATVGALAVLPIVAAFVVGVLVTLNLSNLAEAQRSVVVPGFEWIATTNFRLPFELLVDPLSMTMVLIITGIGSLIHIYSTSYMADDPDYPRFFTYMNLFIAAMLVLVLGNNLAMLFIGWEGVGLCSYLLIGFWYKDLANARAANKAFIVNRVGDWGLLLGMFLIIAALFTSGVPIEDGRYLSYDAISQTLIQTLQARPVLATAIALLLFVGAAGKSAQFPLYIWLPDAMAGPTPVSALIHAATMVTSGVFLLNRMHYVFELSPVASAIICGIGAFTAAFAALVAFGQSDIKKVLAYSTVSQLGFMFIACGAGAYWAGMYHVTTHAFFKALLFLGAGAVIYSMAHEQDMRNYGKLARYLPWTFLTMAVGTLAIAGIPGLSGFASKEAILGSALAGDHAVASGINIGYYAGWIGLAVAALTAMYMMRLMMLTFLGREERWRAIPENVHTHADEPIDSPNLEHLPDPYNFYETEHAELEHAEHHGLTRDHTPKEAPWTMIGVLVVLAFLSATAWLVLGPNFEKWLYPSGLSVLQNVPHEPEAIDLTLLSIIAGVGGVLAGFVFYLKGLPPDQGWDLSRWKIWRRWEADQFGFDAAVTSSFVEGGGEFANNLNTYFDDGGLDRVVGGVGASAQGLGRWLKAAQTGYIRLYALVMLIGGVAFIGYFIWLFNSGGIK